jgi:hypothetical protein
MALKAQSGRHLASHDSPLAESLLSADRGLAGDIPILAESQAEIPSPSLIKYRAPASAGATVRFYQLEMPRNDWAAYQEHLIRPHLAVLSYTKDGRRATIIIHQDGDALTRVLITVAGQVSGEVEGGACQPPA